MIRYFGGWEFKPTNKENLRNFIINHAVDKEGFEFFKNSQSAVEMQIQGNKILKIYECSMNNKSQETKELKAENIDLPVDRWEDHHIFTLEKSTRGNHTIGGEKPKELVMPNVKHMKSCFQYIGKIDGSDKNFKWIGEKEIHIIYPLFEYVEGLFLDYTNPNEPNVLNPEVFKGELYVDKDLGKLDNVHLTKTFFVTNSSPKPQGDNESYLCGVPIWLQEPIYPKCPKTGELMKFLCTISSDKEIPLLGNKKVVEEFCNLIFGDYGYLYVFYHSDSKIMYLEWQST